MSFLSHIGATAFKYEVEVVVVKVQLGAPSSAPMWVEWKRGSSVVRTPTVGGTERQLVYDFGKRSLKLTSTLYKKKDKFQKKEARLTVKQSVRGKEERLGHIDFDLASYVASTDVSESLTLSLDKSADKGARLTFRINTHWLKGAEINSDDEPSRSTNFSTVSGSNENSLNQSPNATAEGLNLDELEGDDDDDEPQPQRGGARGGRDRVPTSDSDEEDARRRVKFNKKPQGRTGSVDVTAAAAVPPKKSNLKGAAGVTSPQPAAAAASSSRGKAAAVDSEGEEEEEEEGIPLFGVSLETIMSEQAEVSPELDVPLVLDVLLRGVEKLGGLGLEGLFRVGAPTKAREELRSAFERGDYRMPKDAHVPAALLKFWLAELKEPLWPERLNAAALDLGRIPADGAASAEADAAGGDTDDSDSDVEYQRRKRAKAAAAKKASGTGADTAAIQDSLRAMLSKLPLLNARVLARLLSFLVKKVAAAPWLAKNKMSVPALAVVFAPNIVRLRAPEGAAAAKRGALEEYGADVKRSVVFLQHLANNLPLVEAAARGEIKSPNGSSSAAAGASTAAAAAAASAPKAKSPRHHTDSEDSEEESGAGARRPLQSFAAHDSDDDSDAPPPKAAAKAPAAAAAASRKPAVVDSDESDVDDQPAPAKSKSSAAAAPAAAAAKPAPSPTNGRRANNSNPNPNAPPDDSDDTDEESAKRNQLFKKKGGGGNDSAPAAGTQSIRDALFAKKKSPTAAASSGAASKSKKDATDSEADEADTDEEEYRAKVNEANIKKAAAIAKEEQARRDAASLAKEAANAKNAKPSAKAAFGESEEDSEDDDPRARKPTSPAPAPPVPAAAAASTAKSPSNANAPSSSPSAAEVARLRSALAEMQAHNEQLEAHIVEMEEAEQAGGASALAKLEKENRKLKAENDELKRTLDASPTSSGSSSKQVDSLKKQLSSLMSERDELTSELDELEARYNDARKAANEAKKACKAHTAELEDLRVQLVEAQAAASKSPSSTRGGAASAAPSTPSRSSAAAAFANLDEEKLREECALLQLRLEELSSESAEKLASERKLRAAMQAQLAAAKTETDQLRSRQVRFEDLSVLKAHTDPKKNAKDKLQMDLIAAYEAMVKRDRFLETQLKECDQTLLNAKNGWQQTVTIMQEQIASMEADIEELKRAAAESNTRVPVDQQQMELLQKKLRKSEQARSKLSELMAALEADMSKKKLELKTAHQSIIDLQQENKRIKEDLVRSGLALKTIADDNFELKEYLRMNAKGKK